MFMLMRFIEANGESPRKLSITMMKVLTVITFEVFIYKSVEIFEFFYFSRLPGFCHLSLNLFEIIKILC